MKTMHPLALACAGLLIAGASYAQTSSTDPSTTRPPLFTANPSIHDNPGILGHSYADLNYSWVDYHRDAGLDADGFIAGLRGNAPISRGLDLGLGYNYYRENNHRNPFTGTPYDARFHEAMGMATLFSPSGSVKPFLTGGIGYQWSRGDIQRLRTYDHEWVWSAGGGVEFPMRLLVLTPRVTYNDSMRSSGIGSWNYGAQAHHWFNEKLGGYLDATFHDPKSGGGAEWWTYTAGLRVRF